MLWDFGFRWHEDLQTKWIDGVAGLGGIAKTVDSPPKAGDFMGIANEFLAETNPELLEMIKSPDQIDKEKLVQRLEKNFRDLQELINTVKREA